LSLPGLPQAIKICGYEMESNSYARLNSLRLEKFDYSTRRVYFVTTVVLERRNIFFNKGLAQAVLDCLFSLRIQYSFKVYCYCLMPDHFHGLTAPGESGRTLGDIMGGFKSLSTKEYWKSNKGKLWQPRFNDHIVRNEQDFYDCQNYILMNPVKKGLVKNPEDWPFSGILDIE
jgi:putative transposase